MPATIDEVRHLILEQFPDADLSGLEQRGHRILGVIVAEEFRDLAPVERNRLVSEAVRHPLGLRGMNVGILIPLAPGEDIDV